MRKSKSIKIDDLEIIVKELRVKDVRKLLDMAETSEDDMMSLVDQFLPMVTDLKTDNLENMAPSELKIVWEAFSEVNADFLEWAGRLGIMKALGSLIQSHLTEAFADSLSVATQAPGSMDGDSF